jgi:hypothetical protein
MNIGVAEVCSEREKMLNNFAFRALLTQAQKKVI